MKSLVVIFSPTYTTSTEMQGVLDGISEVTYWYRPFPQAILCTSTLTAHELAKRIEGVLGVHGKTRFVVFEVQGQKAQGRLPKKGWHLINTPDSPRLKES